MHTDQISGQLNTITTAVPFLLITPDARASALGDAGCASTPGVYSNYWNASKYAFIEKKNGISFSYTPWLRALVPDIYLLDLSAYKKIGKQNVVAISGRYFSLGNIMFTNIIGTTTGQFRPREYYTGISYSRLLTRNFSVGTSVKYIYSNLTGGITILGTQTYPGQSFAGDISCFWKDTFQLDDVSSVFSWGVNIQNIGQKISYSDRGQQNFLPQNLRIGVSYKMILDPYNSLEFICDVNKLLVSTPWPCDTPFLCSRPIDKTVFHSLYSSFYDAPGGFKEELHEVNIASGIEYWYDKTFAVRTGYFYEHATKGGRKYFTLGIGVRYMGIELDGSYLIPVEQRHPLQNTLRMCLSFEFDSFRKKKT